jgi:hypothetical protein
MLVSTMAKNIVERLAATTRKFAMRIMNSMGLSTHNSKARTAHAQSAFLFAAIRSVEKPSLPR